MSSSPWGAPGPARFLGAICDDLDSGIAVCVELPATVDEFDLESGVAARFELRLLERLDAFAGIRPLAGLADALDLPASRSPGSVRELVRAGWLEGRLVWIAGLAALDSAELGAWLAVADEIARAAEEIQATIPVVLCVSGPNPGLRMPDTPRVRHHRWWDVIGRLDTAVLVVAAEPAIDIVAREEIVELAGDDYVLATQLALVEPDTRAWAAICGERAVDLGIDAFAMGDLPSRCTLQNAREAWLAGVIATVDGQTVLNAGVLVCQRRDRELTRRRWAAQIRTLLPQMDLARVLLLDLAADRGVIAAWRTGDGQAEVEFSDIARILARRRDLQPQSALARWLRNARNQLAHLQPLGVHEIDEGRRLAARAGFPWT